MEKVKPEVEKLAWATQEVRVHGWTKVECKEQLSRVTQEQLPGDSVATLYFKI